MKEDSRLIKPTKSGRFLDEIEKLAEDEGIAAEAQRWWDQASSVTTQQTGEYSKNTRRRSREKRKLKFLGKLKSIATFGQAPGEQKRVMDDMVEKQLGYFVDKKTKSSDLFNRKDVQFQDPEEAHGYTFEESSRMWNVEKMTVRIATSHFAEGGMRKCYQGGIILDDNFASECVFKIFKKKVDPMLMFRETLTQVVSSGFADSFNLLVNRKLSKWPGAVQRLTIIFLPVSVALLPAREKNGEKLYATIEPFLKYNAKYTKLNDNVGRSSSSRDGILGQAFSYYTFVKSRGFLVVCDIQGVDRIFTDPQIHSLDPSLFGAGNFGIEGINRFLNSFVYSPLCRRLGLPRPEELQTHFNQKVLKENQKIVDEILEKLANRKAKRADDTDEERIQFDIEQINAEKDMPEVAEAAAAVRRFSARRASKLVPTKELFSGISTFSTAESIPMNLSKENHIQSPSILNKLKNWRQGEPTSPELNVEALEDYTRKSTIAILDELVLDDDVYNDV